MAKIIIEAAINGAVAKKTLNPNFAYSPREIADDAIATCEAGAAIVHFHALADTRKRRVNRFADAIDPDLMRARVNPQDPQKGQWGRKPVRNGCELRATVKNLSKTSTVYS